jgi:hypothetical protein
MFNYNTCATELVNKFPRLLCCDQCKCFNNSGTNPKDADCSDYPICYAHTIERHNQEIIQFMMDCEKGL